MRALAFLLMPGLLLLVGVPLAFYRARRMWRVLDAHLRTRGVFRLPARRETRHCRAGVVGGVGVRLDFMVRRKEPSGATLWWQIVRASRDAELVHAGLELPETSRAATAGYREQAALDPSEAEQAARKALEELPQRGVELRREGELVEARIAADATPEIVDRMIDVACAWVDGARPAPAAKIPAPSSEIPAGIAAAMIAILVALFVGSFAVIHSDWFADLVEHVCDPGDRLVVHAERSGGGTGYDYYCRTAAGETYGCAAIEAASFDLVFPFTYAAVFAGFYLRRLRASKQFKIDWS